MAIETSILSGPRVHAARDPSSPPLPVLIQVPALIAPARRPRRPTPTTRRPGRRRLRREIRVAATALAFATPLSWLLMIARPVGSVPRVGEAPPAVIAVADPPIISISIEPANAPTPPATASAPAEMPCPVTLDGVVPDPGCEEGHHEGG